MTGDDAIVVTDDAMFDCIYTISIVYLNCHQLKRFSIGGCNLIGDVRIVRVLRTCFLNNTVGIVLGELDDGDYYVLDLEELQFKQI